MTGLLTERLRQACDNAVAMWTTLARARGDDVVEHPAFTAIDGRRFRIMLRTATPGDAVVEELTELAAKRRGEGRAVVVEDPFRVLDLTDLGLTAGQLPVMAREPGAAPERPEGVERVTTPAELAGAEDLVVHGFPLEEYQPYRPGTVFPPELLDRATAFFRKGGQGACLTMAHGGVGGVYWVTTMPEHRSQGVGRALMYAVLRHFEDVPVTLTASRSGRPLYEKLGFANLGDANWWR
ncbi:GNAT family N-acetyltransferase [Amycolatopsis tolypomycina]|uniref:Acetyltransferase (GNAT) family protein n=1 Tax=Amycolatopsis tolypomycina TaxID=208445 RepID=A0A1H5B1V8_9PSEU|nr:GNAT family N-acetyltransferase [Amycolatopsis tolypomycina]SED48366.1 Acetyltransferase (GNAT) family protein [Amycolatopsis tolypomycina]